METFNPGQTVVLTVSDIPSGSVVGFQVLKALTGTIAVGRTTAGVTERPLGTGNYVISFVAPAEGDLYMVVVDWNGGVLDQATSKVIDIEVAAQYVPGSTGLGLVGDYVKVNLGGETWKGLAQSPEFGEEGIAMAIETVKRRISSAPILVEDEGSLPVVVLDYIALLAALQLIPAARDYWGSQLIAESTGDDSTEIVTYPNRATMIDTLRDDLMRKLPAAQALAIPLLNTPVLRAVTDGPDIDEDEAMVRSTDDPRCFPPARDFPYRSDVLRTGVQL